MIEPSTEVIGLESRLGRVGSIQKWDAWKSRESVQHAKWWVAKVASLSYGNEEAKNPEALFDTIIKRGHLSCLEFVPVMVLQRVLPHNSLRQMIYFYPGIMDDNDWWDYTTEPEREDLGECSAFLVEAPIFVARQWMRHRSFAYLEMSRRYVKGAKVPFSFYGGSGEYDIAHAIYAAAEEAYDRLIEIGQPPELARTVLPVGLMTRFWAAGYDSDWRDFVRLRSDAHAQPEIRVFSDKIADLIA